MYKQLNSTLKSKFVFFFACIFISTTFYSCVTSRDTVTSRGMQNLTARYNIIYNSNLLLDESITNIETGYLDDFTNLLSVYKEPSETASASEAGILDSVIKKANTIVDDKLHSKYVDDAYLLIAKANYLKSQFFNASEYYTYIYESYPKEHKTKLEASIWNARALLQLENTAEASIAIDSALKYIDNSKKLKADVYATRAQYLLSQNNFSEGVLALNKALDFRTSKSNKIRWRYLLAQLQEKNMQHEDAYKNYSYVVKSNAPFEMAFNANLNRIKIEDEQSGKKIDRITRLKSLLKDDKNKDFNDQIYYNLANYYLDKNQVDAAIENYKTAAKVSTINQNQKGLSFLKLADIYFANRDYLMAKAYYDSTITSLSPKYPGFDLIKKKGDNLELLANRYQIIAREDTLQMLARLPEAERERRIGEIVRQQSEQAINQVNQQTPVDNIIAGIDNPVAVGKGTGKFYFNNTAAIGQGFSDFKRRWGNRRLEDNWRRVAKTAAETTQSMSADPDAPIGASVPANTTAITPEASRETYKNLPLTEPLLFESNKKIAEAFYDIGNFYKDELKDDNIAIKTYEELLNHTPQSDFTLPVYYNLYRLYQPTDIQKSNSYRDLVLSKYPDSPFAKVISDPNYSQNENDKEQQLNIAYDKIFTLYTERKYDQVNPAIRSMEETYSNNKLSPQLAYLNALTIGHTKKLPAFEVVLEQLVTAYPGDKLVTPLVKQHLEYIKANRVPMAERITALLEYDPSEPSFVEEPVLQAQTVKQSASPQSQPSQTTPAQTANTAIESAPVIPSQTEPPAIESGSTESVPSQVDVKPQDSGTLAQRKKVLNSQFSLPGAAEYYFVVNVLDASYNLSSSRFGIGQFNRTRYQGVPIRHQLQELGNENQLVFVGKFDTFEDVRTYANTIQPLLKDIMKVPTDKFNTFIITKDGLDKLKDSKMVNSYIEFFKNSY
jgi:tetratricopeptide (TPR) repeat protein